jgi:hypothetical protein
MEQQASEDGLEETEGEAGGIQRYKVSPESRRSGIHGDREVWFQQREVFGFLFGEAMVLWSTLRYCSWWREVCLGQGRE